MKASFKVSALLAIIATFVLAQSAGAASYTWTNAPIGNWSTATSWSPNSLAGGPTAADTATFNFLDTSSSPTTVNNVVDLNFTIATLIYSSTNVNTFQVTQIPTGETLRVTNKVTVGQQNGIQLVTQAFMTGGGTFVTSTTNLSIQNYGSASGANSTATLNMTNLSTFIYTNPAAILSVGDTASGLTRSGGNFLLAGSSNLITVSNINLGTSSSAQAGPNSSLVLGQGTNIINAANLNVANNKNSVNVTFAAPTGGLRIRGQSGSDNSRANITIGNRNQTGTGTCQGQMLLNGSPVDIKAATLTVGANPNTGSTTGDNGTGVLQFDTGTVDATTVIVATSGTVLGTANGTITVGPNGKLIVGSGGLTLLNQAVLQTTAIENGTLNISNGTVVANGNIIVNTNAGGNGVSTINYLTGGNLELGANVVAGTVASPIGNLNFNITENATLQFDLPSASETNVVVNSLVWPTTDSQLTFVIANLPPDLTAGTTITLVSFGSMSGGAYTAPGLVLPPGVTGNLSLSGNTILLTITGGVGPGIGGINQLINPGFELTPIGTGWTTAGNTSVTTVGTATYLNSPTGACPQDGIAQLVTANSGTNVANIRGSNIPSGSTNSWSQTLTTSGGTSFTAGGFTYVSHEDLMTGRNTFYYEVDFLNSSNTLIGSFESYIITNLNCGSTTPFPVDMWTYLAATNQMQVVGGVNTGVVVSNVATGILTAPPGTSKAVFRAVFIQRNATDSGSVYLDDANLGFAGNALPPSVTTGTGNLITLSTNTILSCTATSTVTTISSVQVIATTNTLGGVPVTITNGIGSPALSVTGIGTPGASISYTLAGNTVYSPLIVQVIDADGLSAFATNRLDTIVPALVIEAADFNFTSNGVSGVFIDTPADGGLALYTNQIGTQGIDENKAARTGTQSYYRPSDAVIIQAANPGSGNPPTGTEQKFISAAANGDLTDIEVEVGFNTPGDWFNYTRTYGPGGSAPAGNYNVFCYLATSGSGPEGTFSQVTSDPTQPNQTTTVLGTWGTSSFTDNGFNNYRYVPLVDQFGALVSVTVTNGVQTFRSTVTNNPNFGFYLFVPVIPIVTPTLTTIAPNGNTPFQASNQLSFTISPEAGSPISTNSIALILNGVKISSGLIFTPAGGGAWTVSFPLQSNTLYTATIDATNNTGAFSTYTINFDTFDVNNYQWEAVDYDFSTNANANAAIFLDNPYPTGNPSAASPGTSDSAGNVGGIVNSNSYFGYPGNDINDAVAQPGIDVNYGAASGIQHYYRADTVGTEVATDFIRPKFLAAQALFGDPNICAFDLGWFNTGFWVNYTRTFPTNKFNVWARLAGGNGPFSGTTLSIVTSGVGTSLQSSNVLGTFADASPAGWQAWHWVPLLDTNGNMATIQLSGQATLKLTSGNNLNAEFFMLTPANTQAGAFSLSASQSAGQFLISFPTQSGHNYTVLRATNLTSTSWTPIGAPIPGNGFLNVVTQAVSGPASFFRVQAQ
jgi:hypothetical protein